MEGAILLCEAGPEMLGVIVPGDGRKPLKLLNRNRRLSTVKLKSQGAVWLPRDFPICFQTKSRGDGGGGQDKVQLTALQGGRPRRGKNLSPELAGDSGGRQVFRSCLPITSNDEGSLKVVKELQKLPQEIGVERGLKRFPSAQVQLDEIELQAVSLHYQRSPSIALLGVGVDMMDEVSGGKQGEEAPGGASVACRFSLHTMTFPAPAVEVLQSGVQGFPLEVCLLEEHDGVALCPDPILNLFPEEGDVAEGDVEGLVARARFLR